METSNVTVPVAAGGKTVAVAVTGWFTATGVLEIVNVVVETAWFTVKTGEGWLEAVR